MPTNAVAGLATLFLNGNDGVDTFGQTPTNAPPPAPPIALPMPPCRRAGFLPRRSAREDSAQHNDRDRHRRRLAHFWHG